METQVLTLKEQLLLYWDSALSQGPKILFSLIILLIFVGLGLILQKALSKTLKRRMTDSLLSDFLARVLLWIVILIGFSLCLKIMGWGNIAGGILAGAGMGAIIVGLAFRDLGENLLSGVFLAFARPFKIGDTIDTNGINGKVVQIDLRNTHLKTFDGKDTYIPNSSIIKNVLSNHTIDGFMRYDFEVGVSQTTDKLKAIAIIQEIMENTPGVLNSGDKKPQVVALKIESEALLLRIYFWINTYDNDTSVFKIKTTSMVNILDRLIDEEIALQSTSIELKNVDREIFAVSVSQN